ncbi:MAG TPA: nodulation protein NfeD [Bdellovibrionota bacterium]|nr:nodulation protein NfeD [Bdellovibrionota bacterium]
MRALLLPFLFVASAFAVDDPATSLPQPRAVWVAQIQGTINPASSDYLTGAIRQAEAASAEALIVELDTPGGLVSSVREMAQSISRSTVPVIVFVTPAGASATSAGALLMLASHLAVMSPGTNIGAAHPVDGEGKTIEGAMGQKVLNDTVAFARGLADLRGRNRTLAEEVVAKSRSLTAEEAQREKLIEELARSREELLSRVHGRTVTVTASDAKAGATRPKVLATRDAAIRPIPMTFGQSLLHYLANPNIAALLLTIGMLLIYIEASHPGLSIPGIAGAICLLVAFMALQMLPIRVGAAALLALGIALLLAEPFITSHGIAAGGGILCFVLGLLWLVDPASGGGSLRVAPLLIGGSTLTLGGIVGVIAVAAARMRALTKKTLAEIGGGGIGGLQGYAGRVVEAASGGLQGRALFRGEVWEFESQVPLSKGDEVKAVGLTEHMKVKVERAGGKG